MSSSKLKNAPLKEVIFELYWEGISNEVGIISDKGFDLAQGKFSERIKAEFPFHEKTLPDFLVNNLKMFGSPIHRYWKGYNQWPLIQHGEGIIAINEVELGYEWDAKFKPLVLSTIHKLVSSYDEPLKFNRAKLQYIDVWDLEETEPINFVANNLQTKLISHYTMPGTLSSFNIQQNFELPNGSVLNLNIYNGKNSEIQKESVVLITTIELQKSMDYAEVTYWIDNAHDATSRTFKEMLKPEFYASLNQ